MVFRKLEICLVCFQISIQCRIFENGSVARPTIGSNVNVLKRIITVHNRKQNNAIVSLVIVEFCSTSFGLFDLYMLPINGTTASWKIPVYLKISSSSSRTKYDGIIEKLSNLQSTVQVQDNSDYFGKYIA